MKKETIATINGVDIVCFSETKEKLVPMRPICYALGVNYEDEAASISYYQWGDMIQTLSEDLWDDYGVIAIPLALALGWVINIDYKKTTLESHELSKQYMLECHKAIADYAIYKPSKQLLK